MAKKERNKRPENKAQWCFRTILITLFSSLVVLGIIRSLDFDISGTKFEEQKNVVSEEQFWLENPGATDESLDVMEIDTDNDIVMKDDNEIADDKEVDTGHDIMVLKNHAEEHRGLGSGLLGLRILYVICMYDLGKLREVERMMESVMDMCVAGSRLTVVIQTTESADDIRFALLQKKLQCSGSRGSISFEIDVYPKKLKLDLTKKHRQLMYDRLDNFDLFIYSEDDMDIRPSTIAAYLAETSKLEAALPDMYSDSYPHQQYVISFIRWEENRKGLRAFKKERFQNIEGEATRVFWENTKEEYDVIELEGLSSGSPRIPYVTMVHPHSAMWILTRDQLMWLQDTCQFNSAEVVPGKNVRKNLQGKEEKFSVRVW
eukprot:CAMPEP_0117738780 /NCGR_PEP_ID=MMETSP0947-20121206/3343_1 /TAXON_ID=44440 /ORGANISM="Chattonella subsalsa, Strain CCMP2191" /LENGTH=373 /DNA_ID=CAMNT_0005554555 /DNA_START=170 /DNA_END=1288 /DNA_ORIENTATION=+